MQRRNNVKDEGFKRSLLVTICFGSLILTSMNISPRYRKPVLIAVLLHGLLFGALIFNYAPTLFRMPPSSAPMNTIHATAISQADVQTEINTIQQKANEKQIEAQAAEKKIMKEKAQATAEKLMAARAAANAKQKAEAHVQAALKAKKMLEEKAVEKKVMAEEAQEAAKKLQQTKAVKQQKLMAEQKKLQQKLLQQQLATEQKNISQVKAAAQAKAQMIAQAKAEAAAASAAQQGVVDKYKAEILSAIQSNWRIDQVNSKLKCVYSVQLAPDGTVLSLRLVQSSGDSALDQSAQQAITASSPLPVPNDPGLFNHFRQLVLTLSPQGFLQSVSGE